MICTVMKASKGSAAPPDLAEAASYCKFQLLVYCICTRTTAVIQTTHGKEGRCSRIPMQCLAFTHQIFPASKRVKRQLVVFFSTTP